MFSIFLDLIQFCIDWFHYLLHRKNPNSRSNNKWSQQCCLHPEFHETLTESLCAYFTFSLALNWLRILSYPKWRNLVIARNLVSSMSTHLTPPRSHEFIEHSTENYCKLLIVSFDSKVDGPSFCSENWFSLFWILETKDYFT